MKIERGVALFTRAWIEIELADAALAATLVALFTRAWIEICYIHINHTVKIVALFTRAWIEIGLFCDHHQQHISRPLHEGVD